MVILVEGEKYPIDYLEGLFKSGQFYTPKGYEGVIRNVGYYHDLDSNILVFMLPKVFLKEDGITVFGLTIEQLKNLIGTSSVSTDEQFQWIRNLSIYFYKSLVKFKQKFPESTLINYAPAFQLKGIQKTFQYSYLDIVLSFVSYYKKYKHQILFKHIDSVHANAKKPKWEKTIRKGRPILAGDTMIYDRIRTKSKIINNDEQLIVYYYSILNHLNEQYDLGIHIEKIYPLIKGARFRELMSRGLPKLKKIKYRYFTDWLKEMHTLCILFFSLHDQARGKSKADFITVSNYNIIFEDMVDRLFSDDIEDVDVNGVNLNSLKHGQDGKILDHIFDHRSLFDDSSIFYIGDSKYYRSGSHAGQNSRFKQFTYAKNVIQYNIDLLNEKNRPYKTGQRYRDDLTEGYNITPNFFIYGYIDHPDNYELNELRPNGEVISSYHFKHRLFDRDTLFVHQYKINFLFVLKAYSSYRSTSISRFRQNTRNIFRNEFIKYFSAGGASAFSFFKLKAVYNREEFLDAHFKTLNGKAYCTTNGDLLLAHHRDDKDYNLIKLLEYFEAYNLA